MRLGSRVHGIVCGHVGVRGVVLCGRRHGGGWFGWKWWHHEDDTFVPIFIRLEGQLALARSSI